MRQGVPADQYGPRVTGGTRAERTTAHRPRARTAGAAAHEIDVLFAAAVRKVLSGTHAYGGVVYLHSRDRRSLVLTTVAGVPLSLLSPMRRIAVAGPLPVALSYRTGRTVSLADSEETMRRFPQLAVGMPYDFASACVPIGADGQTFGVLSALWPAAHDGVPDRARRQLRTIANRLGGALAGLAAEGHRVEAGGDAAVVELPTPAVAVTRVGLFDWNLATGAMSADDEMCEIFGVAPADFDGRAATLGERITPADRPEFRAAARAALDHGRVLAAQVRVRDQEGRPHPVELWGRVPATGPAGRAHLVGTVLDSRTGTAAAAAVERLRDGVFSLDPDGRAGYVNRSCELLLNVRREDLVGRHPWEVLPWLADPVYEDRYRAAMLSQQPTAFLAHRPPDSWLAFSLYPDAHGVTGRVVAAEPPDGAAADLSPAPPQVSRAAPGTTYHLLQLASALTEAVSVKEVCQAVADQILPAFGGQQLALYTTRDNRLHLVSQTGYPDGFLDSFEGTPMGTRLPGAEALSTGTPIFFESVHQLSAAYPGIPLDEMRAWAFLPLIASGHPVGSCILGFDEARSFTADERGLLTALGGFIAQALERARLYDAEFALARGLQQALLPHRLPTVGGVRMAARYLPGTQGMEIGGDWYDAVATSCGVCLVIGDVEGHNVGAAATMGQLRSAVRAFAGGGDPPGEVLARTNRLMVDLDPGLLASCLLLYLQPANGHVCAARAGHLPPLLRHPGGHTEALDLPGGPLLGIDHLAEFPVTDLVLEPGAVLALYTDGLVEEPGTGIDQGIDRLRAALAHADASTLDHLADRLLRDARRSVHRADDVALLLTEYSPGYRPGDPG